MIDWLIDIAVNEWTRQRCHTDIIITHYKFQRNAYMYKICRNKCKVIHHFQFKINTQCYACNGQPNIIPPGKLSRLLQDYSIPDFLVPLKKNKQSKSIYHNYWSVQYILRFIPANNWKNFLHSEKNNHVNLLVREVQPKAGLCSTVVSCLFYQKFLTILADQLS